MECFITVHQILTDYQVEVKRWMNNSMHWRSGHSLHGAESSSRSQQSLSCSRITKQFMEPNGSLPCSQEPASDPYHKPDESSPYLPILFLRDESQLSLYLRLGLSSGHFHYFPSKPYILSRVGGYA
jgi:hypothetical protein